MKEIEMIRLQEEHIKKLQDKLDEKKKSIVNKLLNTEGWLLFILKRTPSYYRPTARKDFNEIKREIEWYGKMDFIFDDKDTSKVSFRIYYSRTGGYNFRTISFPIDEIEEFIKDSSPVRDVW